MKLVSDWVRSRSFLIGVCLLLVLSVFWRVVVHVQTHARQTMAETIPVLLSEAWVELSAPQVPLWSGRVSLPFRWDDHRPYIEGEVHLRLWLPPNPPDENMALWMPRVGNQVEVRTLQGQVLARWGQLHDAAFDATKAPRLVELPQAALAAGQVLVVLSGQPSRQGGMGPVLYGPMRQLLPLHQSRADWRKHSSWAIVANMALLTVLSAGVWWFRRDFVAVDLGLGALSGVLVYVARVVEEPPLGWPLWGVVVGLVTWGHLVWFLSALMRMFSLYEGALCPRLLYAIGVAAAGPVVLAFAMGWPGLWTFVLVSTSALSLWALYRLSRKVLQQRKLSHMLALGVMVLVVSLLAWDLVAGRILGDGVGTLQLAPVATLLAVATLGFLLVNRQIEASEVLDRVRQIERERIMRDLHDGVGGQLMGLRALLAQGASAEQSLVKEVDSALDEMRLTIDALQPSGGDLCTLLATLRYRLQSRFDASGIRVAWHLPDLKADLFLPAEHVFHVQRIVMEALTNVLKHSGASQVAVRLEVPSTATQWRHALIFIEDDGRGIDCVTPQGTNLGLKNMQTRADLIGAELQLDASPNRGTKVQLRLKWQPNHA